MKIYKYIAYVSYDEGLPMPFTPIPFDDRDYRRTAYGERVYMTEDEITKDEALERIKEQFNYEDHLVRKNIVWHGIRLTEVIDL